MNKRTLEQYKEEFENMSYCDLTDEFNEPLISITKSQDNLLKIIYINYAKERDENYKLKQVIDKAIELIEKQIPIVKIQLNMTNINTAVSELLNYEKLLEILKGKD